MVFSPFRIPVFITSVIDDLRFCFRFHFRRVADTGQNAFGAAGTDCPGQSRAAV